MTKRFFFLTQQLQSNTFENKIQHKIETEPIIQQVHEHLLATTNESRLLEHREEISTNEHVVIPFTVGEQLCGG